MGNVVGGNRPVSQAAKQRVSLIVLKKDGLSNNTTAASSLSMLLKHYA